MYAFYARKMFKMTLQRKDRALLSNFGAIVVSVVKLCSGCYLCGNLEQVNFQVFTWFWLLFVWLVCICIQLGKGRSVITS